jgi:hypothetical protein
MLAARQNPGARIMPRFEHGNEGSDHLGEPAILAGMSGTVPKIAARLFNAGFPREAGRRAGCARPCRRVAVGEKPKKEPAAVNFSPNLPIEYFLNCRKRISIL